MSDISENSSIIPQWAETTFDKLRRGTMRNLEPPKINLSKIFFNDSDSTSLKDSITTESKSLIVAPVLKPPKRVYKNTKKINKSPTKATKEGRVTKNRKKPLKSKRNVKRTVPVKDVSEVEKSTLPEDNVLFHELVITQDHTKENFSFPSIITPNFKSTLFTSTPVNLKSSKFHNNNHLSDFSRVENLSKSKPQVILSRESHSKHLSSIENLSKSKLDDKFNLKCQVVINNNDLSGIGDLSTLKSDSNLNSNTQDNFNLKAQTHNTDSQHLSSFENLSKSQLDDKFHLKCQVVLPHVNNQDLSTSKTDNLNSKDNLQDLSVVENLIKSKFDDKFYLNCQVVLPRLETDKIKNLKLNNKKNIKLPIVRLERLNTDKFIKNLTTHENSLSLIESSFSRSFKLRIKFKSTKNLFKRSHRSRKSNLHLLSWKSFTNFKNLSNIEYKKKKNITLDPQLLLLCTKLNQEQINMSTNSKLITSSSINLTSASVNKNLSFNKSCEESSSSSSSDENVLPINPNFNCQEIPNENDKSLKLNLNNEEEAVTDSDHKNKEQFISIKKSLITKRRGGTLSGKIKRKIIQTDEIIDLTSHDNNMDSSVCEIIDISSSEESICSNKSIKSKLKTPNNLHCKVLLRNFTNNITSSSTPNKMNNSNNITKFSTPNKSNELLNITPNQSNENRKSVISSPTLPDKIYLKPGKHWQRSLSILRNTFAFKNPNDYNIMMTGKKKGRKWRSTCFEIKNDNKSVCLNAFSSNIPQTKDINTAELLSDSQSNLNESIPTKRISIRIVPAIIPTTRTSQKDNLYRIGDDDHNAKHSDLEIYARISQNFHSTGYVSKFDHNKIQELDDVFDDLSLDINNQLTVNESVLEPSLIRSSSLDANEYSHCITAQDIVLKRCNQTEPLNFDYYYPDSVLQKCQKLGEGVYGEVFLLKNADGSATVLKIIPIEGSLPVNGEHQKKFDEIISEIIITQELSGLRDNTLNCTECYTYVKNIRCVRGKYPSLLIDLWELYDEMKGSENEHPGIFDDDQLYIVFELDNGGRDLESYEFLNAEQAYSIFIQTALALSVAENELEFEHRDLHWGNLLIQSTKAKTITFKLNGKEIKVNTCGVKATIIDFTLSRVTYNNVCIYNNLADDPDLFKSVGDYQFEIYKMMQKRNQDQWEHFEPYSNILWLHYVILKMIYEARYKQKKSSRKHSKNIELMKNISNELLTQQSSEQFVVRFYYQEPNEYTKAFL